MEALGETVLPGAAWLDVQGLDLQLLGPSLNRPGDELRTFVTANVPRHSTHREQLGQCVDHIFTGDAPVDFQRQALV